MLFFRLNSPSHEKSGCKGTNISAVQGPVVMFIRLGLTLFMNVLGRSSLLHHDLAAIIHVNPALRGLGAEPHAVEGVPAVGEILVVRRHIYDSRLPVIPVAEIHHLCAPFCENVIVVLSDLRLGISEGRVES